MPFGRHPSAKTKETTKAGGPLLRINRKDCDVPTKKKVRRRRTLFCCGGRAKPLYPFRVLWRLFSTLSRLCESLLGMMGPAFNYRVSNFQFQMEGKKEGGYKTERDWERERREGGGTSKRTTTTTLFFSARSVRIIDDDDRNESDTKTHLLSLHSRI